MELLHHTGKVLSVDIRSSDFTREIATKGNTFLYFRAKQTQMQFQTVYTLIPDKLEGKTIW